MERHSVQLRNWPAHYPDGTPVNGTLNYAMSTSLLSLGGQLPLVDGQATCVMVTSPAVLGLVGQTQVALNFTGLHRKHGVADLHGA
jgi:hypothetical protein